MRKSLKILIGVLIALVIISGFFIFLLFDHINTEKKIDNIIQSISHEVLTDDELNYLSNKKLLNDEQKAVILAIKYEVVATSWDEHNLDKLELDKKEFDDIMDELSNQLTGNIKDRVVILNASLAKIKPHTQKQKEDKQLYQKNINESIDGYSIKKLIQKEKEFDQYVFKINELSKAVDKANN